MVPYKSSINWTDFLLNKSLQYTVEFYNKL